MSLSKPAAALVALAALIGAAACSQAVPSLATATPPGAWTPAPATPADPAATQAPPTATPSAEQPTAQPLLRDPQAEHTVGDTIRLSGGEFVGDQADLTVEEAVMLPTESGSSDSRFAFLVEITGLDAEVLPYNLREFSLLDDQNFEYQPLPDGGQEPRLEFGDLLPERSVRGWLTFEVPHATSYVELQYWPTMALEPAVVRALVP